MHKAFAPLQTYQSLHFRAGSAMLMVLSGAYFMSHPILEQLKAIKTQLNETDDAETPAFALGGTLAANAVAIEVEGLGVLSTPLSLEAAAALAQLTVPAPFGHRDKTLLDVRVRDVGELAASAVKLQWRDGVLSALLAEVANELGVEGLTAHLHKLLVYGPGQFFKTHQDTEKLPGMVATLVLVWPCAHLGGELRVTLGEDEQRFASQQVQCREIRWFAFYADCRHELLKVEDGYRIALSFDLVINASDRLPAPTLTPGLQHALRTHFNLPEVASDAPLVIMLDHEYSENGLRWRLLKGADRSYVAHLRSAAESLGLVSSLALAELMQIWSAEVDGARFQGRRGYQRRVSEDDVVPGELIDQDMSLNFWVDRDENILRDATLKIPENMVLSLSPTDERFLVSSEYEGYMGNYGETIEYWYRRAALVIQAPAGAMRTQFVVDFPNALAQLKAMTRLADGEAQLRDCVLKISQILAQQARAQGRVVFADYVEIALHLNDAELARDLLAAFAFVALLEQDAPMLGVLELRFGTPWICTLLDIWTAPERDLPFFPSAQLWPVALASFLRASQLSKDGFAGLLRALQARLLRCDRAREKASPAQRGGGLQAHLAAVGQLATVAAQSAQAEFLQTLIDQALANPRSYPLLELDDLAVICAPLCAEYPIENSLAARVGAALRVEIALLARAPNDYTLRNIEWPGENQECLAVRLWATSPSSAPLVLPLAESRRRELEWCLRAADAPLSFNTIKQGSPHKLQLHKPVNLQEQDQQRRLDLLTKLARLSQRALIA